MTLTTWITSSAVRPMLASNCTFVTAGDFGFGSVHSLKVLAP